MINPMDLTGRTIVVTGASSGIGRETAILLSQLGARIVLIARDRGRLEQAREALTGSSHVIEALDLTELESVPPLMKRLAAELGPLHSLVHCAGGGTIKAVRFTEFSDFSKTIRTNLESGFALAKGFRQRGVCAPSSSIVFIASVAALAGFSGMADYSASKGGLVAMTRTLAVELAREGIRVNCVAPGWVKTELTRNAEESLSPEQQEEFRRKHLLGFGTPRDVSQAIAFLVADTGRWITGSTLVIDGGLTAQ